MSKRSFVMPFAAAALLIALVGSSLTLAQDDATVAISETPELGSFLTDAEGMTLYLFTKDEPGKSNCTGDCLANWPAFTAEDPLILPEGVPGELTQITRDDGTQQVAYNGWPLYYWAQDEAAGDTTGQGVGDVWYVVAPGEPGSTTPGASPVASPVAATTTIATSETPELGTFLTDAEGMTLYLFTRDEPGVSNCSGDCLANWPAFVSEDPLTLPDGVPGELTQITRDDGTQQVAYNDWPLYYWAQDQAPGDTTGQGVGDVWYVVAPGEAGSTTPPAPPAD